MIDPIPYLVRIVHIVSAVTLVGGLFYAWNLSKGGALSAPVSAGFKPSILILVALQVASGLYQFLMRIGEGVPRFYHMIFGIKFLLFLHIAAVAIMLTRGPVPEAKRNRMLTGLVASGLVVLILGTTLRSLQ